MIFNYSDGITDKDVRNIPKMKRKICDLKDEVRRLRANCGEPGEITTPTATPTSSTTSTATATPTPTVSTTSTSTATPTPTPSPSMIFTGMFLDNVRIAPIGGTFAGNITL